MMSTIEELNRVFFLQINGNKDTPVWLINVAVSIAEYLIYLIPVLLISIWLYGDSARRNLIVKAFLVTIVALGLSKIIGQVWPHPRPFMLGIGHVWLHHSAETSFPSDHMSVLASIGLTLLFDGAVWLGLTTLIAGLFIAWARIFVGVHYPLDMLGAVGVAVFSYFTVSPLWHRTGIIITSMIERLYRIILAKPISAGWIKQ